jgi:thiosulfate/3-mercaptopyruvate sulfurtransferase
VDCAWLASQLVEAAAPVVIDSSWHLPTTGRDARAEYVRGPRIPTAVFWDIDSVASRVGDLPHMLPSREVMEGACERAHISSVDSTIVLYDSVGCFSAPRLWWTFRVFGFSDVKILDGGLPAWLEAGNEVWHDSARCVFADGLGEAALKGTFAAPARSESALRLTVASDLVTSLDQVKSISRGEQSARILDARPAGRFQGTQPEPRAGIPSGHMPGSANVPFLSLLEPPAPGSSSVFGSRLLPTAELERVLGESRVDWKSDAPIVTTCGSGVSAAIVTLALHELGRDFVEHGDGLFDGAWIEYAKDALVGAKGEAEAIPPSVIERD